MTKALIVAELNGNQLNSSTSKCISCAAQTGVATIDVLVLSSTCADAASAAAAIDGVSRVLTLEAEQYGHHAINITSTNGQLIYNGEMEGTTHQLDLSSFHKGVYLITIRSEDFVTTKKIVKL